MNRRWLVRMSSLVRANLKSPPHDGRSSIGWGAIREDGHTREWEGADQVLKRHHTIWIAEDANGTRLESFQDVSTPVSTSRFYVFHSLIITNILIFLKVGSRQSRRSDPQLFFVSWMHFSLCRGLENHKFNCFSTNHSRQKWSGGWSF